MGCITIINIQGYVKRINVEFFLIFFWKSLKVTLKSFAVYSVHPPGFFAYLDKNIKNIKIYKILYKYALFVPNTK